jgi:hypothetical protein
MLKCISQGTYVINYEEVTIDLYLPYHSAIFDEIELSGSFVSQWTLHRYCLHYCRWIQHDVSVNSWYTVQWNDPLESYNHHDRL